MKKLAIALLGASAAFAANAQVEETAVLGSTFVTTAVTIAAPIVLLGAVTASVESNNETVAGPAGNTSTSTSTSTR